MQSGERWSSTGWVLALVANAILCIVLAARVHVSPPTDDVERDDDTGVMCIEPAGP